MAAAEESSERPKGPSLVVQAGLLVALSAAAGGMGWFTGGFLGDTAPLPAAEAGTGAGGGHEKAADKPAAADPNIFPLETITTNLAAPSEIWMRLELSLVFDGSADAVIADAIHQDILAYLRTVKLHQIDGASGFQHLKTDLEERAAIRSDGRVIRILIRTFLFE